METYHVNHFDPQGTVTHSAREPAGSAQQAIDQVEARLAPAERQAGWCAVASRYYSNP